MNYKICPKCENELPATLEFFERNGKYFASWCRICRKEYKRKYYHENREIVLARVKKYSKSDRGKLKRNKYRQSEAGKAAHRKANIKFRQTKKGKEMAVRISKKYYENNKLSCCMSKAMRKALKGNKRGLHWQNLVTYNIDDLKQHLENLFRSGMSWNNYGEWHIDHKIPVSNFEFISFKDKEFQECWALENLQPLWAMENFSKGNVIMNEEV